MARVVVQQFWMLWPMLLLVAKPALADEFHFEDFRYGQRATGLGGAVTAVSGAPGNSYYNPALLGLLQGSRFSGSMHVFGFNRRTRLDTLRELVDGEELFEPRNMSSSTSIALPTAQVMSARLTSRHTVALSTFLVSKTNESYASTFIDNEIGNDVPGIDQADFIGEYALSDSLVQTGLNYAWNNGRRFAFGATLSYGSRSFNTRTRRAVVVRVLTGVPSADDEFEQEDNFYDLTLTSEGSVNMLSLRLGAFWQATERIALGLACSTRSLHLSGRGRVRYTLINSRDQDDDGQVISPARHATEASDDLPAQSVLPWSCRGGTAWKASAHLTLSMDAAVHVPVRYDRLRSSEALPASIFNDVDAQPTINGMLGAEWLLAKDWPLRAGLFTNRSSAPAIPVRPTAMAAPQEHRYGVTGSVGYMGKKASINFGLEFQTGQGHAVTFADLDSLATDDPRLVRIRTKSNRLMVFISGGLNFAQALAKRELKKMRQNNEARTETPTLKNPADK